MMSRIIVLCCLLLPVASLGAAPGIQVPDRKALGIGPAEVALSQITYLDAASRRAEAIFVRPPGPGPHPAVLFVHWLDGDAASNGRTQFMPDALALARQGIASLLVDTPWSDPAWFFKRNPEEDLAMSEQFVRNLGRALDVLLALDGVDASRLAYAGHDFGAMYGATLAATDRRPTAWVFVAGTDRYAEWFTLSRKLDAATRAKVFAAFKTLDPVENIGAAAPAPILFQFANKDPFVTRTAADALVAAARSPKDVQFYECGHEMNRKAMDDRVAWLTRQLK
jgi:cephalosporin-C deacetylase-like acetyl esterase